MKTIPMRSLFSLCFLVVLGSYAQTTKTFKESFEVNKDVEVNLNTYNAEIIVETWNKNRVEVVAEVSLDIEDDKLAKELLDKFQFEALGNSSKVEIKAGRGGRQRFPGGDNVFFSRPGNTFQFFSDDVNVKVPPPPPFPEMPDVGFKFDFDMDKFYEDGKAYIIEFQDEMKNMVNDSTFRREMKEWKVKVKEEMQKSGLNDSIKVFAFEMKKNLRPALKEMEAKIEKMHMRTKVKKKITIKMPKDAKLNLDVKRSQLKIADIYQIDANLNYSGLQIEKLRGENCRIQASYSRIDVAEANALNLNIRYAKKVDIGKVVNLVSISKTSNLHIKSIENKALIEGSFAELVIDDINSDFTYIDINLRNSNGKVNLPDVPFNFYINTRSSRINMANELDYNVNQAFDSKIYQNKKPVDNAKTLNVKVDYSNFQMY